MVDVGLRGRFQLLEFGCHEHGAGGLESAQRVEAATAKLEAFQARGLAPLAGNLCILFAQAWLGRGQDGHVGVHEQLGGR